MMKLAWSILVLVLLGMFIAPLYEMLKSKKYKDEKKRLAPNSYWDAWETERMLEKPFRIIYDKEVFQLRKKAFYNVYPTPWKVYLRLLSRNTIWLFSACKSCLFSAFVFGKTYQKNKRLARELENERTGLKVAIQQIVFGVWGDKLAYEVDPETVPIVDWRDGGKEIGADCDIYALKVYGEVPAGVLKNIEDRFKSLVNEPIVRVRVVELPNGKTTKKELVFLIAKREGALHKVRAYFYDNQVKTV